MKPSFDAWRGGFGAATLPRLEGAAVRASAMALGLAMCVTLVVGARPASADVPVTTVAGTPSAGSTDGVGSAARFNFPSGVAVNSATGTVYVADSDNNTIRAITPGGAVSTVAGLAGSFCDAVDGVGSAARFCFPQGVAVNSATGTVYVADGANTIRAITPAGAVTTLAGAAFTFGSTDGVGSAARFDFPQGVAVNSATGTVYVADSSNHTIRAITPGGAVSTLAGLAGSCDAVNGVGSAARFCFPSGVAVNSAGTVYVADSENSTIRAITPAGAVSTLAGLVGDCGDADGMGGAARFCFPQGVAVNPATGTVYVADQAAIRTVTPAGAVSTLAGQAFSSGSADGVGSAARFNFPRGVAVNSATGTVYVADTSNHVIRTITPAAVVATFAGLPVGSTDGVGSAARFNNPLGVAVNSATGTLYVADYANHTIRAISPGGAVSTLAGLAGSGCNAADGSGSAARFCFPSGIAVNSATGTVYVADGANTIRAITPGGAVTTLAGAAFTFGSADGVGSAARFGFLTGVAVNSATGTVYVADAGNNTIRAITPGGTVSTLAGLAGDCGAVDGVGSAARFCFPIGVAVSSGSGTVYVADSDNNTIRAITPGGAVSTVAGLAGSFCDTVDGVGSAARFCFPSGVAVNRGNVYVADRFAHTIRLITPAGAVSTLAGEAFTSGSADGEGSAARFNRPEGVAVNSATGTVYVADSNNNTIRRLDIDIPAQTFGDFDGDGKAEIAVFRPSTGTWYVRYTATPTSEALVWGGGSDVPVARDYDGDGVVDIAVFRPSTGTWYIRYTGTPTALDVVWGGTGDVPVPNDFDGDGKADIAVFRPSTGTWYIRYTATPTALDVIWGGAGDVPMSVDFDGDGKADIAVFRPSTGTWYIRYSATPTSTALVWGGGSDVPVPADFDGDGKADIAVFRPSTGTWYLRYSATPTSEALVWGGGTDIPVPGDFDGDGLAEIAVFRPSTGTWYIRYTATPTSTALVWGGGSDIPVLKRP